MAEEFGDQKQTWLLHQMQELLGEKAGTTNGSIIRELFIQLGVAIQHADGASGREQEDSFGGIGYTGRQNYGGSHTLCCHYGCTLTDNEQGRAVASGECTSAKADLGLAGSNRV